MSSRRSARLSAASSVEQKDQSPSNGTSPSKVANGSTKRKAVSRDHAEPLTNGNDAGKWSLICYFLNKPNGRTFVFGFVTTLDTLAYSKIPNISSASTTHNITKI